VYAVPAVAESENVTEEQLNAVIVAAAVVVPLVSFLQAVITAVDNNAVAKSNKRFCFIFKDLSNNIWL
jgi:hypothetical protein